MGYSDALSPERLSFRNVIGPLHSGGLIALAGAAGLASITATGST
jgi:hypothetical protein